MKVPVVLNIQKYSIHDGDGIRTTVFFKGCPLNCLWCHNPESQCYQKELMYYRERCTRCGYCERICPSESIFFTEEGAQRDSGRCSMCESCIENCMNNAREFAGKQYSMKELIKEIEKDKMFYEASKGGVTLSGGEVMTQDMDYIEELLKGLKKKGFHVSVDTCGYAPWDNFERVLPYTDVFLYDIKHMDTEKHQKLTGVHNGLILDNLKKLGEIKADIYLRIPLIKEVNDDENNISQMIEYIREGIQPRKIFLLPYHNTGMSKYARLGKAYEGLLFEPPSKEKLEEIKRVFCESGFEDVKIGG